jgi:serine/threonine protein kinase
MWKDVSPMAKDLLKNLIQINPFDRLSAEEAMLHPWIRADDDFFFPNLKIEDEDSDEDGHKKQKVTDEAAHNDNLLSVNPSRNNGGSSPHSGLKTSASLKSIIQT